VDTSVMN